MDRQYDFFPSSAGREEETEKKREKKLEEEQAFVLSRDIHQYAKEVHSKTLRNF